MRTRSIHNVFYINFLKCNEFDGSGLRRRRRRRRRSTDIDIEIQIKHATIVRLLSRFVIVYTYLLTYLALTKARARHRQVSCQVTRRAVHARLTYFTLCSLYKNENYDSIQIRYECPCCFFIKTTIT